jgi:ATP-dependent DNA helicase RecG
MLDENPETMNVLTLIAQGMGEDLHWFPESVGALELAECLTAMANTRGGRVIVGVAPRTGNVQGVSDIDAAVDMVFQACLLAEPVLVLPVPAVYPAANRQTLIISVPDGLPNVYNIKGRYLRREGRYTSPFPARDLRGLLVARGVLQFESRVPPDAGLDDLDEAQIEAYIRQLKRPETDWQQTLLQRGCLAKEGDRLRPTYAALLIFGKNPQRWLPNASILAARFPGISFSDEFVKQDIAGTLPQQLRMAELFLKDNLQMVVRMVGLTRQEAPEYPFEAVRELLVNAVAHRDYNLQGDNIHLYLYSDRLEVHSPGGLPGPVNMDNLLRARFSRNAVIAQVLSDMGFVERLGYGLNRVVTVMKRNGLRAPYFEEAGGAFRVSLYGQPFPAQHMPDPAAYEEYDLNTRQQQALNYLVQHQRITSSDYQELCPDVHPETLRRDFSDMVKQGLLIKMGSKRATYYILKSPGSRKR